MRPTPGAALPLTILLMAAGFPTAAAAAEATRVERLANGLTVILREDRAHPIVAICTHVDGGSRTERESELGLSHYYEHTVFRGGTAKQAELETRKAFRELGDFGGYTTDDHTTYYMVVPSEHLGAAFPRYADALLGLEVTADKIERDRQTVVQEYAMRVSDSPSGLAWTQLFDAAFERHPYRSTPIGSLEVITKAPLEAFRTFYLERYVPNQMVLAAVGDFDSDDLLGRIRAAFDPHRAGRSSFELGRIEPAQTAFRERFRETRTELVYGTLGFKVPELAHPDSVAVKVLDAVLLSGRSSRLWRALKERRPLAVDLWSDPNPRRDPSLWVFGFSARPEDEGELVTTLFAELGRIAREGVAADELERVRALLSRDLRFEAETPLARAVRLADYAVKGALPLEPRLLSDVAGIGSEELRAAARYLTAAGATLVLVRPPGLGSAPASYAEVARERLGSVAAAPGARGASSAPRLRKLASGLRLIERPEPGSGVVAIAAAVRGGQWLEAPDRWGASALLARVLPRGTLSRGEAALADELDALGARISAEAEEDLTTVTLATPAATLERALPLYLEVLLQPRLDPEVVGRARKELLAEIASIGDDSFRETHIELRRRLFGALPYAHPLVGEAASVELLGPAPLGELHRRAFVPANLVLAAAGDFDGERLAQAVERAIAALPEPARSAPAPALPVPAAFEPTRREYAELERARSQVTWSEGRLAPGIGDASSLALRVASRALGSRLFFRWVYEEGLAYRMWTRYTPLLGPSPFWLEMGVDPLKLGRALPGVEAQVTEAGRSGLGAEEVTSARESLIQAHVLDRQTALRRAQGDARNEALGLGMAWADELPGRVRALRVEDVNRALSAVADPGRSVRVVLGPPAHVPAPPRERHDR